MAGRLERQHRCGMALGGSTKRCGRCYRRDRRRSERHAYRAISCRNCFQRLGQSARNTAHELPCANERATCWARRGSWAPIARSSKLASSLLSTSSSTCQLHLPPSSMATSRAVSVNCSRQIIRGSLTAEVSYRPGTDLGLRARTFRADVTCSDNFKHISSPHLHSEPR